ncbi:hypothetical protein PQR52_07995 [Paraburkholderia aspalathi]|uniref:hypothetical protein n=1 Tax=Paraburkholderia aspalathi TaxID=1324617 RepID=UPI0038BC8876
MTTDRLMPGQRLNPSDGKHDENTLRSPNNRFRLILQVEDGNLVIYDERYTIPGRPIWASGEGHNPGFAVMQEDGNFVVYDNANRPYFETSTFAINSLIVMQDDGNLVIYQQQLSAKWASDTVQGP